MSLSARTIGIFSPNPLLSLQLLFTMSPWARPPVIAPEPLVVHSFSRRTREPNRRVFLLSLFIRDENGRFRHISNRDYFRLRVVVVVGRHGSRDGLTNYLFPQARRQAWSDAAKPFAAGDDSKLFSINRLSMRRLNALDLKFAPARTCS